MRVKEVKTRQTTDVDISGISNQFGNQLIPMTKIEEEVTKRPSRINKQN